MIRKSLIILPWILLVLLISYTIFSRHRGYIGPIKLPQHDGFLNDEAVQWWYWTGHLKARAEDGREREFGFEICIFAFNKLGVMKDILTQVAITDVADNSFHFEEYIDLLTLPVDEEDRFTLTAGPNEEVLATGGNGIDHLKLKIDDYQLELDLTATGPPWLHYYGNLHPFIFGGFTYYYSRPNMKSTGQLTIGDKTYQIEGVTWFDRQYGDLLLAITQGWQWGGIKLDDGTNIMLFDFLGDDNKVERFGSLLDADGNSRHLGPNDFEVEVLDHWTSPDTGCRYPARWRVTIDEMVLEVRPKVADQELRVKHGFWLGPEYWEGTAYVTGTHQGDAYVELNGYCRGAEGSIALE